MGERTSIIHIQDPRTGECYTTRVISNHPVPPDRGDCVRQTKEFYAGLGLEVISITRIEENDIAIGIEEGAAHGGTRVTKIPVGQARPRHRGPGRLGMGLLGAAGMLAVIAVSSAGWAPVYSAGDPKESEEQIARINRHTSKEVALAAEKAAARAVELMRQARGQGDK